MKYLITGVAGLLGSRLADWLIENTDDEVIGIDDLSGGYIDNVHEDVEFYKFDLSQNLSILKNNSFFYNMALLHLLISYIILI